MPRSSGDQLAPVTYLFGGAPSAAPLTPGETQDASSSDVAPTSAGRAGKRAENVSLHGLTRRNMSRWEIERLLTSRDIDADTIAKEVRRLEDVGLIDDFALAQTLIRTGRERKRLGHQALLADLRRRHIAQDVIDAALEDNDGEGNDGEQQRANELAIKRAAQLSSYDAETAKRRLTAFLMRRGYSSSIVRAAADMALNSQRNGVRFQ